MAQGFVLTNGNVFVGNTGVDSSLPAMDEKKAIETLKDLRGQGLADENWHLKPLENEPRFVCVSPERS